MALLRGRRKEDDGNDDERHYRIREKMFSIGDDYWVEDGRGQRAFKVNGKALRMRDTLVIEDPSGHEVYTIQEKKIAIRDAMRIERDNDTVATIRKAMISPFREKFSIDVEDGEDLEAKGNIVDHEYQVERDGHRIAEVSKRWFRIRDTYGIDVEPGEDAPFILAIAVCIDRMTHE